MDENQQNEEIQPSPTSALDRITLLADLSNAAKDTEIVNVLLKRPNGQKLYALFVEAISQEIERALGGAKAADQNVVNAASAAAHLADMIGRLTNNIANIERSQVVGILNSFLHKLGGSQLQFQEQHQQQPYSQPPINNWPPHNYQSPYQPPQQPQQPQYPQQPAQPRPQQPAEPTRTRSSRVGGLGSP